MSTSVIELELPLAESASITDDTISVDLSDGRSISVPLARYPRLSYGTPAERKKWRFIGNGIGIHWELLDEDISVEGLLAGRPSGESQSSFRKWLDKRSSKRLKRPVRGRVA
jgi:hypothetical protein